MRVHFDNIDYPKKAAKRLKKAFSFVVENYKYGNTPSFSGKIKPIVEIPLSQAQTITADMLGYRDWHQLTTETQKNQDMETAFDELVDEETEEERLYYQWQRLNEHFTNGLVNQILHMARVSAKSPTSLKLSNRMGFQNDLVFDRENKSWDFCESLRNVLVSGDVYGKYDMWSTGQMSPQLLVNYSEGVLVDIPESHSAIWTLLCAVNSNATIRRRMRSRIYEIAREVLTWTPGGYYEEKFKAVAWEELDNRDFLRINALLAEIFYQLKDYEMSREWFIRLSAMSDTFESNYYKIIKDLFSVKPIGNAPTG